MADYYSPWAGSVWGKAKYRLHLTVNEAGKDVAANKTTLAYDLRIEKDRSYAGYYLYHVTSWNCIINGVTVAAGSGANPAAPWTGWSSHVLAQGRIVVDHTVNGTKDTTVSANYVRTANEWAPGTMTIVEQALHLISIPRATTPTVSPSPAPVGSLVTLSMPSAVPGYTHTATWSSGSMSGTIGTGLGESTTWTVPDVMGEFPGQRLAPIVITVETFNGATSLGTKQVTLFAREPAAAPVIGPHDPNKIFDIRARIVRWTDDDHWVTGTAVPSSTLQLVDSASATATCNLQMSHINAIAFDDYSIVDVDVYNGEDWVYTNHRFVMSRVDDDEIDPLKASRYDGTEYIDYILKFCYLQKDYYWDGATDHAAPTTPGEMIRAMIADAQARGWGVRLGYDFNGSVTSLGEPWTNGAVSRTFTAGTPVSQVLDGLVTDGFVEYRTEYHDDKAWLVLLNPGTGSDYSAVGSEPVVNLALAQLTRAPRRGTSEKRLTRVTVVGDTVTNYGDKSTSADNSSTTTRATREKTPFDPDVFGHMEGWVSASGVATNAAAATIGDNALRDNSKPTSERTFEYKAKDVAPQYYPFIVFRSGDWVLIPDGDNTLRDRVSQITVDKGIDGISITALTGDRILNGTASLAKRQAAQTGGSISGGSGTTPSQLDSRIPAAPVIDEITSEGYWNLDGAAQSAVTISWAAVTEALNGADIAIDLYEVWARPLVGDTEFKLRASTAELFATINSWEPLEDFELRVRAHSPAGVYGEYSENVEITTLAPATDLDGPDLADLYTDGVGGIYAVWGGTLDGVPAPPRVAYVVAEISSDGGTIYVQEGTPIVAAGTIVMNRSGQWGEYYVRLRAYDRLGNPGDVSDPQTITITDPQINPPAPLPPTGLTATAGAGWDASGIMADAWIDLSWDEPTLDIDGNPVTIIGYDVSGLKDGETVEQWLTTTRVPSSRIHVATNETWTFRVRAASEYGALSIFSDPITATADATITAAPAPSAPTLEQYAGILRIKWDGGGMLPSIKYVHGQIATSSGGPWATVAMILHGAGELVVPGLPTGVEYFGRIVMIDELGQASPSASSAGLVLNPITGTTVQTNVEPNKGIKITEAALTAYDVSGNPTFILDAGTGEVWIASYASVFELGASGHVAETGAATTGIAISSENSSFNTFIHPAGLQIRNDQTALSWWEADASDASLVNFVTPRARIDNRLRVGDYEAVKEAKVTGTRLVFRYKGA